MAVHHATDGEKVYVGRTFTFQCCDCKLVHEVRLSKVQGGFIVAMTRNNRKTAARRRKRRK